MNIVFINICGGPVRYNLRQLMDTVFTVGQYRLVSAALNTLCVQLDAYLQPYAT